MGLGYSKSNTSTDISKLYQTIIDTLKKTDIHYEVKKHLIMECVAKLRTYVISDSLIDEILITDKQESVIISGIFQIQEINNTYVFMKIKKNYDIFETCFKEMQSENIKQVEQQPVIIQDNRKNVDKEWPELPKRKRI